MGECITDTVLQLLPNGASCHADAVALQWWYVAYNQVQVLIKPSLPADFQYSEGVGRVTGYVCDVTEELVPEVAGQPATCLPPQQRMRPIVLQRPEARNVRRLLANYCNHTRHIYPSHHLHHSTHHCTPERKTHHNIHALGKTQLAKSSAACPPYSKHTQKLPPP